MCRGGAVSELVVSVTSMLCVSTVGVWLCLKSKNIIILEGNVGVSGTLSKL